MSTSMRLRTADRPEEKTLINVTTRSTSDKQRDRKKPEIPTGCRTTRCHPADCIPSSKNLGMCHPTKAAQAATHALLGLPMVFAKLFLARDRHNRPGRLSTNR